METISISNEPVLISGYIDLISKIRKPLLCINQEIAQDLV